MKKICWFLTLVLLLGCFAGCQEAPAAQRSIENEDGTLSDWMKEETEAAYQKQFGVRLGWPEDPADDDVRYYGTENGYVFIFVRGVFQNVGRVEIAGRTFTYDKHFHLYAYRDGKFIALKDAFEQGLVSESAVDNARKIHLDYKKQ